ncbi:MAG: HAMP domain-containing protein [bacterium]|nr:HAMP domain-containing protein [bacterium]
MLFYYYAANYLATGILLVIIIVTLFFLAKKDRAAWLMALFLLCILVVPVGNTLWNMFFFYSGMKFLAGMVNLFIFALFIILIFAYVFPVNYHPRESKIVIPVFFVLCLVSYFDFVITYSGLEDFFDFNSHIFIPIDKTAAHYFYGPVLALMAAWSIFVLIRKIFILRRIADRKKDLPTIRNFILIIVYMFFLTSLHTLFGYGIISWNTLQMVFSSGYTIIFFMIIVMVMNNFPRPTPFTSGIIGITVVTTILFLSVVSNQLFSQHEKLFDAECLKDIANVRLLLQSPEESSAIPGSVLYAAKRPLGDGFFGSSFTMLMSRTSSVTEKTLEAGESMMKQIALEKKLSFENEPVPRLSRRYRYSNPNNLDSFIVFYNYVDNDTVYDIGFSYRDYRERVHETTRSYMFILIGSTLVLFILIPVFYRRSMLLPLRSLLAGVRRVSNGDFSVQVPVVNNDELGYLTKNFNKMLVLIKQSQKELEDFAGSLELKVEERTAELNSSMKELEALAATKEAQAEKLQHLLRIISHDLNNYLTIIKGGARLLLKKNPGLKYLPDINRSTEMINTIIKFVHTTQTQSSFSCSIVPEPVELESLFDDIAFVFKEKSRDKDITLIFFLNPENLVVLAERVSLLNEVMNNLVSNAIKFSLRGGTVAIEALAPVPEEEGVEKGMARIRVSDNGAGIRRSILEKIFDPSVKTSEMGTEGEKGTGFGMPLVQRFVREYGGRISIQSRTMDEDPYEHGTVIDVYLPLAP